MKLPKIVKTYCAKCNSHTSHKLKVHKAGKARKAAFGQRRNVEKHKKGYGGKAKFVIKVKKQNKKPTFLAVCDACSRKRYFVIPKRMKKVELVAA
jgi:large subunit ribosomal protein L44e